MNQKGFTYIEVIFSLLILGIALTPVLSAVRQARANIAAAEILHSAQAQAGTLAQKTRFAWESLEGSESQEELEIIIAGIINEAANLTENEFVYRVSVYPAEANPQGLVFVHSNITLPDPEAGFETAYSNMNGAYFIIAEVFNSSGNRVGISVGMVN